MTGPDVDFAPVTNTTLAASVTYKSVTIPSGVTVTASADLVLTVVNNFSVAGTLTAPCHALTVSAGGALTVTGTVQNECSDPAVEGVPLVLIGKTTWSLNNATLTSSGDVSVVNDPGRVVSTTAELAPELVLVSGGEPWPDATTFRCQAVNTTINTTPAKRKKAPDGVTIGENGNAGWSKNLGCGASTTGQTGGSMLVSGVTINGGSGADGGNGTSTSATPSQGGNGGAAGAVNLTADEDISLTGTVTINGGSGGNGGTATSTGAAGNPGVSVTAIGGKGGPVKPKNFSSPITIQAGGTLTQTGSLNLVLGNGGNGGDATGSGGDGTPGNPGGAGGGATVTGGDGGDSAPANLSATGAVNLQGTVTVSGDIGGAGGKATHHPGNGGAGNAPGAAGGAGGQASGRGGVGGKGQTSAGFNSRGGKGGDFADDKGNGGAGGPACNPPATGGPGGPGGAVSGGDGNGGTGTPVGAGGSITITDAANGGNGGDGATPGAGGAKGNDATSVGTGAPAGAVTKTNSFKPGNPGAVCGSGVSLQVSPPSETVTQGGSGSVQATITRIGTFTGAVTITIKDPTGTVRGSGTIPAGSTTTEIFFSVPAGFTLGMGTWTVTASGTGIADDTKTFQVTVNASSPTSVDFHFNDQANNPITKAVLKTGTNAPVQLTVSPSGTVTVPLPASPTPMEFSLQQTLGNDRHTMAFYFRSDDLLSVSPYLLDDPATGTVTATITGVASGKTGVAFAGTRRSPWMSLGPSAFQVPTTNAELAIMVMLGCTQFSSSGDPFNTVLGSQIFGNGGAFNCDFGNAGLVKSYVNNMTTIVGGSPTGNYLVAGGFILNDRKTQIYSKAFIGTTSPYYSLNGSDLPAGGGFQYEEATHVGTNAFEVSKYNYMNPSPWLTTIGPALNDPGIVINGLIGPSYDFKISLPTQAQYMQAWTVEYSQPNSFGGTNEVMIFTLPHYFGSMVPSTIQIETPTSTLLDRSIMTVNPLPVNGAVAAYGYNPFAHQMVGDTQAWAVKFNIAF